jgi:hypothetical protein
MERLAVQIELIAPVFVADLGVGGSLRPGHVAVLRGGTSTHDGNEHDRARRAGDLAGRT